MNSTYITIRYLHLSFPERIFVCPYFYQSLLDLSVTSFLLAPTYTVHPQTTRNKMMITKCGYEPQIVFIEFDAAENIILPLKFQEKSVDEYFYKYQMTASCFVKFGEECFDWQTVKARSIVKTYMFNVTTLKASELSVQSSENIKLLTSIFQSNCQRKVDQWFRSRNTDENFNSVGHLIVEVDFKMSIKIWKHIWDRNVRTLENTTFISDIYKLLHNKVSD